MKMTCYLLVFLFSINIFGQVPEDSEPLILQGIIKNSTKNKLYVYIQNKPGYYFRDSLFLDSIGQFYYETKLVTAPQLMSIQNTGVYIDDFFVAPGYNLTITCDVSTLHSTDSSIKISGNGAESNAFRNSLLYHAHYPSPIDVFKIDKKGLIKGLKIMKVKQDEVYDKLYNKIVSDDPYFNHFSKVVKLDLIFSRLDKLLTFAIINNYNYQQTKDLVTKNFEKPDVWNDFSNDEWLISEAYKIWVLSRFLGMARQKNEEKIVDKEDYKQNVYEVICDIFSGTVRDYMLFRQMSGNITLSRTMDKFYSYQEKIKPYFKYFSDSSYVNLIEQELALKEEFLFKNQVGSFAQDFTLNDNLGEKHQLSDFKGKVVFLDFWASWCKPCREETPILNKIINDYEGNKNIVFISIAVRDTYDRWLEAIKKDNLQCIHLFDAKEYVSLAYAINSIPRYIIIDKQGKIANFDAPRPSLGSELITEIDRLLQ